ncbi:MAG: aldolase/citrate lyase family protein [Bacteroidales bacterium]|jgi:citrate lyase subunit beta/citryl-CoA lyase|nr:aldolase/citrate lyase family protein [Bacteroidales bacterium]MCU0407537.1 aldolase/citrate lyase family protein [Bacteroidales bacterium]
MNSIIASAGNSGPKVRSDCEITLEHQSSGGIQVTVNSKVKTLYGASIEKQCSEFAGAAGFQNLRIIVNDSGALPFVIEARLEAAARKLSGRDLSFPPALRNHNFRESSRDRFRFTRLYLPGNAPGMMINAGLHSPDGLILDLEDSVAPAKKDEARLLVRNALCSLDFGSAERMVRINQGARGLEDLEYVVPYNVNLVLIPKCQHADEVVAVSEKIRHLHPQGRTGGRIWLMPIIETALGVENAYSIAVSSPDVVALAVGLEDLTADLGVQRTSEATESLYARTRIVNAARAAAIQPIDSVFSDVADMEGLLKTVRVSKSLGFEGMGCIHPRQIPVIMKGFEPDAPSIEKAQKIVLAFEEAERLGLGVVALGSKMIDPPVVLRAQKTINLAQAMGLLSPDWRSAGTN